MPTIYLVPIWFYQFGILINILFTLVAGAVAFYSYKIYSLSCQKEIKLFGIGFLLIALSNLAKVLLFLFSFTNINSKFVGVLLENLNNFGLFLTYSHLALFTIGIVTLVYATLRISYLRVYIMLIASSLIPIFLSANKTKSFLILSAIFLFFIAFYYGKEYIHNKNGKTALIFIGFVLLFLSKSEVSASSFYLAYLIEQATELLAYAFIATSLFLLLKTGRKKWTKKEQD